jgi:hypothetical protein
MKTVGIALILLVVAAGAAIGQEARPTLDKMALLLASEMSAWF